MKNKKIIIYVVAVVALVFILSMMTTSVTFADAGHFRGHTNFSSHHSSSGTFGSRSHEYSSGGDSFFSFLPWYLLFSGGTIGKIIPIIIILIIIKAIYGVAKNKKEVVTEDYNDYVDVDSFNLLLKRDPNFSEPDIQERIARLYIQLQTCWTRGDLEPVRQYLSPQLYSQLNTQLDSLKSAGKVNYIENISVLDVMLEKYNEDKEHQIIYIIVKSRIVDYTIDRNDNIIEGSKQYEVFMTYEYQLIRGIDEITKIEGDNTRSINCPKCGAPMEINKSAKCEYCGSIVEVNDYDWVINNIKGISQDS